MKGQGNESLEPARLVLQGAQAQQVLDPFLQGFEGAVEHGAVGSQAQAMGRAVNFQPLHGGALVGADALAYAGCEDLRTPTRQRIESGLGQALQHLGDAQIEQLVELEDLHRTEGLEVNGRLQPSEAGQQFGVVIEGQVLVEAAHHMDLGDRIALVQTGLQPIPGLLQGHGVRARLVGAAARERAQRAARHAHVGRIDVQIAVEGGAIAKALLAHPIGQSGQPQKIALTKER